MGVGKRFDTAASQNAGRLKRTLDLGLHTGKVDRLPEQANVCRRIRPQIINMHSDKLLHKLRARLNLSVPRHACARERQAP